MKLSKIFLKYGRQKTDNLKQKGTKFSLQKQIVICARATNREIFGKIELQCRS
jgi:hypothetical protein